MSTTGGAAATTGAAVADGSTLALVGLEELALGAAMIERGASEADDAIGSSARRVLSALGVVKGARLVVVGVEIGARGTREDTGPASGAAAVVVATSLTTGMGDEAGVGCAGAAGDWELGF